MKTTLRARLSRKYFIIVQSFWASTSCFPYAIKSSHESLFAQYKNAHKNPIHNSPEPVTFIALTCTLLIHRSHCREKAGRWLEENHFLKVSETLPLLKMAISSL